MSPVIALSGISLETTKLTETAKFYTNYFGLEISETTQNSVTLKGSGPEVRQLTLIESERLRLHGLRFDIDPAKRHEFAEQLAHSKIAVTYYAGNPVIHDPDGTELTFAPAPPDPVTTAPSGRPIFVSHVVLNSANPERLLDFYTRVIGLRVSDRYENDFLVFLRSNQPQHHCVGIAPAAQPGLNHFAMDCGNIDGVMKSIGRMKQAGFEPVWGPGRHAPGGNVFCYFEDPNSFVPEFTCELTQITDEEKWTAKTWSRGLNTANVWGTGGPTPRYIELMAGLKTV